MDETTTKLLEAIQALGAELRTEVADGMAKISQRCDALDEKLKKSDAKKKADDTDDLAEETAADRRSDSVRTRAELDTLRAQVNDLTIKQPRKRSDADRNAFADMQAKADVSYRALGERADQPMQGEELLDYTIRLHRGLQRHSKRWSKAELATVARDPSTLQQVCDSIRADAFEAANSPVDMKPFQHREIHEESRGGHKIVRFVGSGTIFGQLNRPVRHVGYIGTSKLRENQTA
jgi:hypothetical protein